MRIDVALPEDTLERDLRRLHAKLHAPDRPFACTRLPTLVPGFTFHLREADGEFFIYVEDVARDRLAGTTVFGRILDVDRHAARFARSPHSRYARSWQGLGLATAVYEWALAAGLCLVSGPRQSAAAHRLWWRLARRGHPLLFVQVRDRCVRSLGPRPEAALFEDFHTRMLLLGRGCEPRDLLSGHSG